MRHVTRCRWLLRQRANRFDGAPVRDADELGDPLKPLLVEVTHRTIVKKLPRHEQSSLRVHLAAACVGRRSYWGQ